MSKLVTKIFFLLILLAPLAAFTQPQLVVLKGERVLKRFRGGDDFVFRMKGSKTIRRTYINNLSDTAIVTHRDTVPFHKIDRIYFRQTKFYNTIGAAMVIGGSGVFLIDQFNLIVVKGLEPNLDPGLTRFSVSALALGIPLILIKKKSQRIDHRHKVRTVRKGSPFFQPDPKSEYLSPYIDNWLTHNTIMIRSIRSVLSVEQCPFFYFGSVRSLLKVRRYEIVVHVS